MAHIPQLNTNLLENQILVLDPIGQGGFGQIYRGIDLSNNSEVAIKIEYLSAKHKILSKEISILKKLRRKKGFTRIIAHGQTESLQYLVIELLGITLDSFYFHKKGQLPLYKLLHLFLQLTKRLKSLHQQGYTHNDIKPANCVIGSKNHPRRLFLIDFGLIQQVQNEGRGPFLGTPRYQSIRSHLGQKTTYSDDLECMLYCLVSLYDGQLPWDYISARNYKQINDDIYSLKTKIVPSKLFKSFPMQISLIFNYIKSLGYGVMPDYGYIIQLFKTAIRSTPKEVISTQIFVSALQSTLTTNTSVSAERMRRFRKSHDKNIITLKSCTVEHEDSEKTIITYQYPFITPDLMRKISYERKAN